MGERPPGDAPLYLKVAAGLTTGALAIAIASPTDLVKVAQHPLAFSTHSCSLCIVTCHHVEHNSRYIYACVKHEVHDKSHECRASNASSCDQAVQHQGCKPCCLYCALTAMARLLTSCNIHSSLPPVSSLAVPSVCKRLK